MSSLQTYERQPVDGGSGDWPVFLIDDNGKPSAYSRLPEPGDQVCHSYKNSGYGTVVAIHGNTVVVLWSELPASPDFSSVTFPVIRRVAPTLVAQQRVSIQPMTVPSGLLFYMDYAYGSGSQSPPAGPPTVPVPQAGPTVGPPINPCPSNKVAIGPHRQYSGPGYRGPKRGGR